MLREVTDHHFPGPAAKPAQPAAVPGAVGTVPLCPHTAAQSSGEGAAWKRLGSSGRPEKGPPPFSQGK